jgi:hypothetical protein
VEPAVISSEPSFSDLSADYLAAFTGEGYDENDDAPQLLGGDDWEDAPSIGGYPEPVQREENIDRAKLLALAPELAAMRETGQEILAPELPETPVSGDTGEDIPSERPLPAGSPIPGLLANAPELQVQLKPSTNGDGD